MKKFFAILAFTSAVVACNNSGKSEKKDADSVKPVETTTVQDTTKKVDTAAKVSADTTKAKEPAKPAK
jgi:hypothetical protein